MQPIFPIVIFLIYPLLLLDVLMELQNNRVLRYEECFELHRVASAKESSLSER